MRTYLMSSSTLCWRLRDSLADYGVELHTVDDHDIRTADKILFFDLDHKLLQRCLDSGIDSDRLVLLLFEPEAVRPDQYDPHIWQHFGKVITWRDDLVDNIRFFKLRWPQGQSLRDNSPNYDDRKLATMINANKFSYIESEGYSYRRKAIKSFDACSEFDLYGVGWNNPALQARNATAAFVRSVRRSEYSVPNRIMRKTACKYARDVVSSWLPFRSFAGSPTDKHETLARYKFCLCYENQLNRPGYITEKIFDCFFCGTVPIYLGATNIDEYIPRSSYVQMSEMPDFPALLECMRSIGPRQFRSIQEAGRQFITSGAFQAWTPKRVYDEIASGLMAKAHAVRRVT
ncbi:glycosyltransferase family 10 [bacterium]|nr:glycosyltransferase family 10 [bacterium]